MQFKPKGFVGTVNKLLEQGEGALDLLIEAYFWSQKHLKELHVVSPEFSQTWLRAEIRRVFNADPVVYVRTASRLGGGENSESISEGRKLIKKFGISECFRAENLLTPEQMKNLREKINEKTTVEEFHKHVDEFSYKNQKAKADASRGRKVPIDYHLEFLRAERELLRLRAENAKLLREKEKLERKLARIEKQKLKA